MMKFFRSFMFAMISLMLIGGGAAAQTARLQVIHNAADPAAAVVDVYLNGGILLDDFAFRAATGFIDAPANTPLNIGVAPGNSGSAADTLKNFVVTLAENETYIAVANGVLDPNSFAANPDGRSTAFTLFVNPAARETSSGSDVEFTVLHGASDAPTVDVNARNVTTLVNDAAYGDFTEYIPVPAGAYLLDVTDATGTVRVATFDADLSGLGGGAAAVFASGFLNPAQNQNGESFGIFAALANGLVVELPLVTTARLQVIHNAADPAAASVDVYLNDGLLLDNFAFRAATPFIDAPAGEVINVGVAAGNSGSVADTLKNFALTLTPGESYIAFANGVLDPNSFAANPDGRSTAFTLFIDAMAQEAAINASNVEFIVLHGASDAPTVDVTARDVATLVDDAAYGDIARGQDYISVPAASYILDVTDANGTVYVASFGADLSGLAGGAAAVFASGFLNPAQNQNGEGFGIFAALPDGNVVEFPLLDTARLQVIHNAADPAAAAVDVYLNGGLLLDDFAFRTATPFIDAPALTELNIGVAAGNSGSVADTLKNFPAVLLGGATYVAIANGVLDPNSFAANPDGRSTAFTLFINDRGREVSDASGETQLFVVHGATDAPTVDVYARDVAQLVNNAAYSDFTPYLSVPAINYTLDITDAGNTTKIFKYTAPLSAFPDSALTVLASGFVDPSANQNGEAFALIAVTASGNAIPLPVVTGIETVEPGVAKSYSLEQNYPNPFNPSTTIAFALPESQKISLKIFDITGKEIATLISGDRPAGSYQITFDASNLASGIYFYQLNAGSFSATKRMMLIK